MRLGPKKDDEVSLEDARTAAAIGGFLLAAGGIVAAWITWRAVVSVKLDRIDEDLKALEKRQAEQAAAQHDFEKEVRTNYVTATSIADLRAAIDRGFAALTERVDKLMSR